MMDGDKDQAIPDPFDPANLPEQFANQSARTRAESAELPHRLEDSLRRLRAGAAELGEVGLARAEELLKQSDPEPQGALVMLLLLFQEAEGFCSHELIERVAEILELAPAQVRGVVTFHPGLHLVAPVGRRLRVCSGLSCALMGASGVKAHLEEAIGAAGLEGCQCLGACGAAPVMTVDGDLHESLTLERIDTILRALDVIAQTPASGEIS